MVAAKLRLLNPIESQILLSHATRRELLLEALPYDGARQSRQLANGADRARLVFDDEPRQTIFDHFGTEPRLKAITGVPHAIASIITKPNGSGQSIGTISATAPLRNSDFCAGDCF
ncbi:MAG: hypothetical protein USCAAHI_01183 [Beijerinckiaceae bacterium]|nr:MAG: hypothetical protein USCAAHI_01183 [Beijerinckiaceae bacterium]